MHAYVLFSCRFPVARNGTDLTISAPGEYLLRIEQIGLHSASAKGGAQFYISCAQIKVTGSGSGQFSPTVRFP